MIHLIGLDNEGNDWGGADGYIKQQVRVVVTQAESIGGCGRKRQGCRLHAEKGSTRSEGALKITTALVYWTREWRAQQVFGKHSAHVEREELLVQVELPRAQAFSVT